MSAFLGLLLGFTCARCGCLDGAFCGLFSGFFGVAAGVLEILAGNLFIREYILRDMGQRGITLISVTGPDLGVNRSNARDVSANSRTGCHTASTICLEY
jgi:hypothetical protein